MPELKPSLSVRIPVAWGEMDAFQHVNNTVYLRWFETARIAWMAKVDFIETSEVGPILARTEIDYRLPLVWPDTIEVSVGVISIGRSSVTLGYRVTSEANGGAVAAEGITVIVAFDYKQKKSAPIDDALRARIAAS